MTDLLGAIVPDHVSWVQTRHDPGGEDLFPQERAVVAHAVAKRRTEFAAVRWCARAALARLGVAPEPILPGARGAPGWPAGIVGSMTHCAGYRAAVVARRGPVRTIGVDAEPAAALPDGVLDAIALPDEAAMVADLAAADPAVPWDRLLFSAKESVYKAWFPVAGTFLEFHQARLSIDAAAGEFTAELLVDGPVDRFTGRWLCDGGLVLTAIVA
ncbi:4'-phosphopantetheinyl transferase family protein [Krasilnikovia sp. MM14-A1004]|uniref:4'-phosphopantetheinyl transferase family protein n=1 Tax=Krasilnikovia sp. MM14-A1004 TaxID=3373541 RepID=UPI00399C7AAB